MSKSIIEGYIATAVANAGTMTVGYPSGKDAGHFALAVGHKMTVQGLPTLKEPVTVFLTFGTASITVKNKSGVSWPAGARYKLQLEELGDRQFRAGGVSDDRNKSAILPISQPSLVPSAWQGNAMIISLGAPDTADTDGVATAQTAGAAGDLTIDGAAASGGVATLDVPRNFTLTVATTDQSAITFTVTGTDVYGNAMVETLAGPNNNTVSGKKAFKTITQVAHSAAIATNGVSVGFGDVLGLPVFLPSTGMVVREMEDGAAPTAGTLVAGVQTEGGATATDGDVRGTYDPNSAADGAKAFHLIAVLPDPTYIGYDQYTG